MNEKELAYLRGKTGTSVHGEFIYRGWRVFLTENVRPGSELDYYQDEAITRTWHSVHDGEEYASSPENEFCDLVKEFVPPTWELVRKDAMSYIDKTISPHKSAYYRWNGLTVKEIRVPSWSWSTMTSEWSKCGHLVAGDIFTFALPIKPLDLADQIHAIDETTTFDEESVSKLWAKNKFGIVEFIPACTTSQVYVSFIPET